MKNYVFDGEEKEESTEVTEDADTTGDDEGFMEGYLEDEEAKECAECGAAVTEEKKVTREIDAEEYIFCSEACAEEFEESVG